MTEMMRYFLSLIAIFLAAELAEAARASHLQQMGKIQVLKYVSIKNKEMVLLQDIAKFESIPTAAEKILAKVEVSPSPQPGEKVFYTSHGLSAILRQHLARVQNEYGLRIQLNLPQKMTVYNSEVALSTEAVREQIEGYLNTHCSDCRHEVSQVQLPVVPELQRKWPWRLEIQKKRIRGSFSVPIYFQAPEGKASIYWISGNARRYQTAPVAARRLKAGERLGGDDFQMKEVDTTFSDDRAATAKELENTKLRRTIAVGEVIWKKTLHRERAVRFGELTQVLVGGGNWQVSMSAVAQQNGDIGDQIRLIHPRTRHPIIAKVVGPKVARLEQ